MSRIKRLVLQYVVIVTLHSALFLLSFRLPIFSESLFFYRGVKLLVLSSITTAALLAFAQRRRWIRLQVESTLAALTASASLHAMFFVIVPVTVDRSVSTHMLEILEQANARGLTRSELDTEFREKYIDAGDALGRRLVEQRISQNVDEQNGRYVITEQGKAFLSFARAALRIYQ